MAEPNLTSGERLAVYQTMFLINRSFHNIVKRLQELDSDSLFNSGDVTQFQGLVQELQADINTHLMEKFSAVEEKDWAFFDKIKAQRERHLRGEE